LLHAGVGAVRGLLLDRGRGRGSSPVVLHAHLLRVVHRVHVIVFDGHAFVAA
jgi:hypothetical protein